MTSQHSDHVWPSSRRHSPFAVTALAGGALAFATVLLGAVQIENDPSGFHGFPWGSELKDAEDLVLVSSWQHIDEYEFRTGPPPLGGIPLEAVKLTTVGGKFARVTIRYQSADAHNKVLAFFEKEFGSVERMPGSMVRGLHQQFSWRGPETEINLTYQGMGERGIVFIESRTLAPRFNDTLPESAY